MRLLLRNLLDNALRHGADAAQPPQVTTAFDAEPASRCACATTAPASPEAQLAQLAQAFYRPDSARAAARPAASAWGCTCAGWSRRRTAAR